MERGELINKQSWLSHKELRDSYRRTCRVIEKAHQSASDLGEKKLLSGMLSDCRFALEWLDTGRPPGNRRGIERRACYQREKLTDPASIQVYADNRIYSQPALLTNRQRARLEFVLSRLSIRERDCYVLAYGECFSYSQIAAMLQITKGSVGQYILRAQKKISQAIAMSYDCHL